MYTMNSKEIKKALKNLTDDEIYTLNDLKNFVRDYWCGQRYLDFTDLESVITEIDYSRYHWLKYVIINGARYFWIDRAMVDEMKHHQEHPWFTVCGEKNWYKVLKELKALS